LVQSFILVFLVLDVLADHHPVSTCGRDEVPLAQKSSIMWTWSGIWRRTDAECRVRVTVPMTGRWMLRGVDQRESNNDRRVGEPLPGAELRGRAGGCYAGCGSAS